MKGRKQMEGEDIGEEKGGTGRKVDGRVMEAIEEAYGPLRGEMLILFRGRKVEKLKIRMTRLSAAV